MTKKKSSLRGVVQSLGLVFGDIGTSPIYTLMEDARFARAIHKVPIDVVVVIVAHAEHAHTLLRGKVNSLLNGLESGEIWGIMASAATGQMIERE